jgi:hypothetical protein
VAAFKPPSMDEEDRHVIREMATRKAMGDPVLTQWLVDVHVLFEFLKADTPELTEEHAENILAASKPDGQTLHEMDGDFGSVANAAVQSGLSPAELQEAIDNYRAARSENTAVPPAAPNTIPQVVTAEMLFDDVPSALQAKPRQKYLFPDELLNDPEAVRKARSIVNARNYKTSTGAPLAAEEEARAKKASAFLSARRRKLGTKDTYRR